MKQIAKEHYENLKKNINNFDFFCAENKYSTFEEAVPAPLFVKSFFVDEEFEFASLIIGCTGLFELYLNGENITDSYLAPYISNSEDVVFFTEYDIKSKIKKGLNVLGVLLGNGFANPEGGKIWNHHKRLNRAAPAFALEFVSDGFNFSAKDMKWRYSHILFDDIRCGTFCDRRLDINYFESIEAVENIINEPLAAKKPMGKYKFTECEPVREVRRLKPLSISKGAVRNYRVRDCFASHFPANTSIMEPAPLDGGYIYDFGENCSGIPILNIKGKLGQVVHLQFSELIFEGFVDYINVDVYPDGYCQQDIYICRGDEQTEVYIPPFTYHGARYCYVSGIDEEQATEELLNFAVIRNDVSLNTGFYCKEDFVQEIYDACIRSAESNLVHLITDCPAREKNGWTGDVAISAEHYMTTFSAEKCFAQYLECVREAQNDDGTLSCVIPSAGGSAECIVWDSVLFFVPYYVHKYSGDTKIIEDNCDAMMKNLKHHLSLRDERGIIENGMGDWLPVDSGASDYASPLGFCCSSIACEMCRMGSVMFKKIKRDDLAEFCERIRSELIDSIRKEYLKGVTVGEGKTKKYVKSTYRPCQTSQVLGLCFGIFNDDERNEAFNVLLKLIEDQSFSFDCGFLGLRYIFHVLSEFGRSDIAYKMITKPSHPSYANMIIRGETTVWERFVKPGKRIGSHNHHFMADVSSWMIKNLVGIKVNPFCDDPDTILIEPCFIQEISGVEGKSKTPHGEVYVRWHREGTKTKLIVKTKGKIRVLLSEEAKKHLWKRELS